jgi:hypothetical protein
MAYIETVTTTTHHVTYNKPLATLLLAAIFAANNDPLHAAQYTPGSEEFLLHAYGPISTALEAVVGVAGVEIFIDAGECIDGKAYYHGEDYEFHGIEVERE